MDEVHARDRRNDVFINGKRFSGVDRAVSLASIYKSFRTTFRRVANRVLIDFKKNSQVMLRLS